MLGKEECYIVENKGKHGLPLRFDTKAMHVSTCTVSGSFCIINMLCSNGTEEGLL